MVLAAQAVYVTTKVHTAPCLLVILSQLITTMLIFPTSFSQNATANALSQLIQGAQLKLFLHSTDSVLE